MDIEGLILLFAVGAIYFLPTIVAARRHHHQEGAIFVINLFFGWTFVGWVVALAMSASAVRRSA
jgi:Superinfection immunity protein